MTLTALLVVLMAGTEIFRPLRDLRGVLHQGMLGQSAAAGVHALMEARGTFAFGERGDASDVRRCVIAPTDRVRGRWPSPIPGRGGRRIGG